MNNKLLKCLTVGAMIAALALASPVLARGGGGGGGGAMVVAAVAVMVVAACMGVEVECILVAWAAACVPAAWVSQAAASASEAAGSVS